MAKSREVQESINKHPMRKAINIQSKSGGFLAPKATDLWRRRQRITKVKSDKYCRQATGYRCLPFTVFGEICRILTIVIYIFGAISPLSAHFALAALLVIFALYFTHVVLFNSENEAAERRTVKGDERIEVAEALGCGLVRGDEKEE